MSKGGTLTSVADYSLASSLQFLQEPDNHTLAIWWQASHTHLFVVVQSPQYSDPIL